MKPVPTTEAKERGLPGSDTYRRAHIIYLDDLHRDWGVVQLNMEAMRAFADTILVSERRALAAHRASVKEFLSAGGLAAGLDPPWSPLIGKRHLYINYEHLKIGCAFELYLKSRLLARDMVVHKLRSKTERYKQLRKEQERRPLTSAELRSVDDFHFDGRHNFLPGLSESSLDFSTLTSASQYREAVGLSELVLGIAEDYRVLRNQIHLPGDLPATPTLHSLHGPITDVLLPFINTDIVAWTNRVIEERGFRLPPLKPLA